MGKHIEALANGMGGPSMYVLWLACQKRIPATVTITADTGWENDCLLSTGERVTARMFFDTVIRPLAEAHGIAAYFVRAKDTHGVPPSVAAGVSPATGAGPAHGNGAAPDVRQ